MPRSLLVATLALLAVAAQALPASAHAGGKVQLYPKSFRVEHAADGWHLQLVLIDRDSGTSQSGFGVTASGTGQGGTRFGPVTLQPSTGGLYEGVASDVSPGRWTITIEAAAVPGTEDAEPLTKTYDVHLEDPGAHDELAGSDRAAGGPVTGVANTASDDEGGADMTIPLVAGGVLAGAVVFRLRRSRRGADPARTA